MLLLSLSELSLWSSLYISLLCIFLNLELALWSLLYGSCCISLSGCSSICLSLFLATISQLTVELNEVRDNLLSIVCLPEFEVCATLKELTHTLWLADTRHFYHDTTFLTFELLDVRLYNTELVDTSTNNVE